MTKGRDPLDIQASTEGIMSKYAVTEPEPELQDEKSEDEELTDDEKEYQQYRKSLFQQRVRNGAWLEKQVFPELQFAVQNLVPEGYSLIVGSPKVGKSFFVANLALACSTGGYALGGIKVEKRPVLYFALEDGDRRLQTRFHHISEGATIPENLHRVLDVTSLRELVEISPTFQDMNSDSSPLIIVDTLGKVAGGRKGQQSQFEADYALGSHLQNLAKRVPGSSVLAVHHTNKGEHSDFLNAVSGTQGVTAACDAVLVLTRSRKSRDAILAVTGRDIPNETEYGLTSVEGRWELMGNSLVEAEQNAAAVKRAQSEAATSGRYSDRSNMAFEAVQNSEKPISTKDIAHIIGVTNDTAGKYLRRLEEAGRIQKAARGTWKRVSEVSEVSYSQRNRLAKDHSHLTLVSEVSETVETKTSTTSD